MVRHRHVHDATPFMGESTRTRLSLAAGFPSGCWSTPITRALYIISGYRILICMKAVILKLPVELVEAGDACADSLGVSRAEYIRQAIDRMNRETARVQRARQLMNASKKVRSESARVNAEFDRIERDVDT